MGISARQAQSASIGRLLWTWVSGGEAVFALQPQLSEDSSSEEAVAQQPAADITAPVLFKMDKKAADTDGIKGVYVAPNPDQLHMDRALRKAFARRIDPSASLIKESAAGKDLEQMWQSSTQAQNASDFVRAERTAQSAYIN
ncbi:MAG: hypothetical protein J6U96_00375 [Elusimicrobiaceae bacterium]|nr:hypothetical protein [Elusimicrobiaceae bacterium]